MNRAMQEEWRPCPDFEHWYEVSSFGRVRSHARGTRILYQGTDKDGYPTVALNKDGKRTTRNVHRLVCRAFHGEPYAPCREAAHLDGDRTNARADNLKWVGKVQNHFHMRVHGTHVGGDNHPSAKLTSAIVQHIRALPKPVNCAALAREYGVSQVSLYRAYVGKTWRDVPMPDLRHPYRGEGW
jgi:hypothetical protein